MFLMGFIFGAVVGYSGLVHFRPVGGYPSDSNVVMYGSGGSMVLCLIKLGLVIIGVVGGLFLSLFILGWKDLGVIESGTNRTIFIAVLCVLGAIAAFFLEKHAVIIATSFVGAYSFCFGVDCFAHAGFVQASELFLGGSSGDAGSVRVFVVNPKVIALSVSVLVLALLGVVVQYRVNSGKKWHQGNKD
ncbi:hypothetical protein HK100_012201 [Physocladia obscura]|uniref:TM7S3/TM198-like domain-containing protein n=1 Tax=Physocladia obscura TaxID=109957 RepID=A0AAD5T1U9_9FUNG|nr:hypothetical protein HK100_012201 [Physocladia obscura]